MPLQSIRARPGTGPASMTQRLPASWPRPWTVCLLMAACALAGPHDDELHWEHFSEDLWYDVFSPAYRDDAPVAQRVDGHGTGQSAPAQADGDAPLSIGVDDVNLRRLSHTAIARAIQSCHGNMSEAARLLGISRNTLYRRLKAKS